MKKVDLNNILKFALIKVYEETGVNGINSSDFDVYVYVIKKVFEEKGQKFRIDNPSLVGRGVSFDRKGFYQIYNIADLNRIKDELEIKLPVHIKEVCKNPYALLMLGIKHKTDLDRKYYVEELPSDIENAKVSKISNEKKTIEKTRYIINIDNKECFLDVYEGKLEGIKLAEISFDSIKDFKNFKRPSWFTFDVTNMKEFKEISMIEDSEKTTRYLFLENEEETKKIVNLSYYKKSKYNRSKVKKLTNDMIKD